MIITIDIAIERKNERDELIELLNKNNIEFDMKISSKEAKESSLDSSDNQTSDHPSEVKHG